MASTQPSAVRLPVLYLGASDDRLIGPASSALVSQHCSTAIVAAPGAPHFLLQAVPVEAARVVGDFVRNVQDGR